MENVKYIQGDLVKDKYQSNEIFEVTNTSKYGYMLKSVNNDVIVNSITETIIGIPLTPEILEKNGWEKDDVLDNGVYVKRTGGSFIFLSKLSNGSWNVCLHTARLINCKYVHQFQHLLFGLGLDNNLII